MPEPEILAKYQGSLIGTFIGDALGAPFEGQTHEQIRVKYGRVDSMVEARLGAGTYTDDTEMMISLAESMIPTGNVDPDLFAARLLSNFSENRGYGGGSLKVIEKLRQGIAWQEAAKHAYSGGSFGNGAAMRIAPVGVRFFKDLDRLSFEAELSAKVTHTHPQGVEGAKLQAMAVALAAAIGPDDEIDPSSFVAQLASNINDDGLKKALDFVVELMEQPHDPEVVIKTLGADTTALRSVPTAIYSFLRFNGDFAVAVSEAVSLGGDSDTIGAMTGAIAGAHMGVKVIPQEWYDVLENDGKGRDYILTLAESIIF